MQFKMTVNIHGIRYETGKRKSLVKADACKNYYCDTLSFRYHVAVKNTSFIIIYIFLNHIIRESEREKED